MYISFFGGKSMLESRFKSHDRFHHMRGKKGTEVLKIFNIPFHRFLINMLIYRRYVKVFSSIIDKTHLTLELLIHNH